MKELTFEEFVDRTTAIQRARRIFIDSGLINNVTHAFQAYQAIFAEREREIFININAYMMPPPSSMYGKYKYPLCLDCGATMNVRQVPENPENIKIQLVCSKCDTVLNSEEDLQWWMNNLKVKDGHTGIPQGVKEDK
jgi:hypothetical protein